MVSRHTSGSWMASGEYVYSGSRCIAICDTDIFCRGTNDANARMMSAAPDLLDAAKEAKQILDLMVVKLGEPEPGSTAFKLTAAIAKAEGRS